MILRRSYFFIAKIADFGHIKGKGFRKWAMGLFIASNHRFRPGIIHRKGSKMPPETQRLE